MRSVIDDPRRQGFIRMLGVSFLVHAVLLSTGLVITKGAGRRMAYVPVYTTVEMVDYPVRGDGGARRAPAGRRAAKETVPPKTAENKAGVAKKKPSPTEKKGPVKKRPDVVLPSDKAAGERTIESAISSIEDRVEEKTAEKTVEERIREIEGRQRERSRTSSELERLRGEILSGEVAVGGAPGRGRTGGGAGGGGGPRAGAADVKFKQYYNTVGMMIQSEWIYPGDADRGLHTVLSLRIAPSGALRDVRVERRSGNTLFDETAIKAAEKAAPFPSIPEDMKQEMDGDFFEIGVRFCPGGCDI